jgi:hypothetical protein
MSARLEQRIERLERTGAAIDDGSTIMGPSWSAVLMSLADVPGQPSRVNLDDPRNWVAWPADVHRLVFGDNSTAPASAEALAHGSTARQLEGSDP